MSTPTREIIPVERIDANLKVPGSRNHTILSLVCAVLAEGDCHIRTPLRSDETTAFARALGSLGYEIEWGEEAIRVGGRGGIIPTAEASVDLGDAVAGVGYLTSLLSLGWGMYEIRATDPEVGQVIDALGYLGGGARLVGEAAGGARVVVEGAGLRGGKTFIRSRRGGPALSATVLVSPYAENGVEIEASEEISSKGPVDLTVDVMGEFGVRVERDGYRRFQIPAGRRYRPTDITIEGDASSASYFFAAAAVTGGRVRIENLDAESPQGDARFVEILDRMGCHVERGDGWTEVSGGDLQAVETDLVDAPDLAPTLAVTSLFARGKTVLRNAEQIEDGDSDRVGALTRELRKVGAGIRSRGGDLEIQPKQLRPAEIETYQDPRMAMSFALIGLKVPGVRIRDPACVSAAFPDFFDHLEMLGQ